MNLHPTEHEEAVLFADWCETEALIDPRLSRIFAIPNGGHRHIAVAQKLKAEGVKKGVPDYFLPVAASGYHGLFIELKTLTGKASKDQKQWIAALNQERYLAVVAKSGNAAIAVVQKYLGETLR
jgi:hypothetical protein